MNTIKKFGLSFSGFLLITAVLSGCAKTDVDPIQNFLSSLAGNLNCGEKEYVWCVPAEKWPTGQITATGIPEGMHSFIGLSFGLPKAFINGHSLTADEANTLTIEGFEDLHTLILERTERGLGAIQNSIIPEEEGQREMMNNLEVELRKKGTLFPGNTQSAAMHPDLYQYVQSLRGEPFDPPYLARIVDGSLVWHDEYSDAEFHLRRIDDHRWIVLSKNKSDKWGDASTNIAIFTDQYEALTGLAE